MITRTCKLASLFLALAMLLSFGSAFAQEAEVETEAPAVSAPVEETAAPAEQPATEAPATEAPAHTAVPEKNMVNVGYAQAEGAVFVYTEPVISDATRIGQFTATSYTLEFDLGTYSEHKLTMGGQMYTGGDDVTRYFIRAKYEAGIESQWPTVANFETNSGFAGWSTSDGWSGGYTWVSKRINMTAELCSQGYLKGHGAPVYGYYGNGQWMVKKAGQEAIDALNLYPYDVDEAIALLEADGWTLEEGAAVRSKDGQELTINWVRPETSEVADLLESMLTENFAKAGIGLTVTKMSYEDLSAAYYRQTDRSEYDMFFLGSNFGMTFNAYPAVSTEAAYQGAWNTTAIADEELEALALDMNRTKPGETKAYTEKWLAFQTRWVEDLPMAPLYSNEYADLFTEHLQNYRPDTHFSWAAAILDAYVK